MVSDPKPLAESLNRFLANLGAPPFDVVADLDRTWADIVGPALALETKPVSLVGGELLVSCRDSAWASQILWCTGQIQQRFQQVYPQIDLVKVKTRVRSC